ncbi:universal stress protein [Roseivirga sp. BDSF3-8]|uniref:universal stress protein n=1 Tax=Roseivirga sp. BDSF3-8 TaxID=3241598 RepID=UPI003531F50A
MYRKLAVAIAFSPRVQALLAEAARLRALFDADLLLIHIGDRSADEEKLLESLWKKAQIPEDRLQVIWEQGDPARKILSICQKQQVDLLVAGALRKENFVKYYLGSIARRILRRSECSVLMLIQPSQKPKNFRRVVINGEGSPYSREAIKVGCELGKLDNSRQLHIIRAIKMYGLAMAMAAEASEEEYSETKKGMVQDEIKKVDEILKGIDTEDLKINVKVTAGKSGYELAKFALKADADLLIAGAPANRLGLMDRVFPHDLEYVFADMPCNVLIINKPRR